MVGDVTFGAKGEWAQSRVLQVQFQNVKSGDVDQFRDVSTAGGRRIRQADLSVREGEMTVR